MLLFILKQKNYDVAILQMDEEGNLHDHTLKNKERMPFLGSSEQRHIYEWWAGRAIPDGRERLEDLLKKSGYETTTAFLMKNLGLSLTDTYWICPSDADLTWEDVNLFQNGGRSITFHDGEGRIHYSNSPDAGLGGNMEKYAIYESEKWHLIKKGDRKYPDGIQNVNEAFASMVHQMQAWPEYVKYSIHDEGNEKNAISDCLFFTSEEKELISAHEITGGNHITGSYDPVKKLTEFIGKCEAFGLDKNYVQNYLDYMFLSDFVLTNADRHWNNFGVIRNPENMTFISMAPLFDTGNSMFFDSPYKHKRLTLVRMEDNGINRIESKRLNYVKNKKILNAELLPDKKAVLEFYCSHGISEEIAENISTSYQLKVDLLHEFQHGLSVSFATEMEYLNPPFVNGKPNPLFFKERVSTSINGTDNNVMLTDGVEEILPVTTEMEQEPAIRNYNSETRTKQKQKIVSDSTEDAGSGHDDI